MRAGALRQRVTIQGQIEVADGHHGFVPSPVVIADRISAQVTRLSGRELDRAQQIDPRASLTVSLRYRTDVKAGQTVVYHDGRLGDRPFEIVAPPEDVGEQHRELLLTCGEAAT